MLSVQSEIVEGLAPLPSPQKVLPKLKSSKSGLMFPVNLGRAVEIMKNSQTLNFGVFFPFSYIQLAVLVGVMEVCYIGIRHLLVENPVVGHDAPHGLPPESRRVCCQHLLRLQGASASLIISTYLFPLEN